MKIPASLITIALSFCSIANSTVALTLDEKLEKAVEVYQIDRRACRERLIDYDNHLVTLGELVFETKAFSGEKDTACATCHIRSRDLIDGLPVAVGVGGEGEGSDRLKSGGVVVPRNAFTLIGRGDAAFEAFFWDARIERDDRGAIISPIGQAARQGFTSLLAVASVQPLLARDEFLGKVRVFDENAHIHAINDKFYEERAYAAVQLIRDLLNDSSETDIEAIRDELDKLNIDIENVELSIIGNALAAFIADQLSCVESPWSRYLSGDIQALNSRQKEGALIFYGRGRCASCHSGRSGSDFRAHSIASPQGRFGVDRLGEDFGRSNITLKSMDRYKFRTPPLVAVSKTAPYGHSGQFNTLHDVVLHHINPIQYFVKYQYFSDREMLRFGHILRQRDILLQYQDIQAIKDVELLVEFLRAL